MNLTAGRQQGSVLVAVLWLLAMMGVFAMAVTRQASQELLFGQWLRDRVLARNLAEAGIERALIELRHDKFKVFDSFQETWGSNPKAFSHISLQAGTYSVICEQDGETLYGACDESGRININKASPEILKNLMMAADSGIGEDKASAIADAIEDWRDGNDDRSDHGAESSEYHSLKKPYEARNGDLESVEELNMVMGMTPELFRKIRPYVTVYTDGRINFNTAPKAVFRALGLSEVLAGRLVDFRKGADGMTGTLDDEVFQDTAQILPALSAGGNFSGEDYSQLSNALSLGSASVTSGVFRVNAMGSLNREARKTDTWISCVMKRDGTILSWREGRNA